MKKYVAVVASVAFGAVALVGCGGQDDFCDDATEEDVELITSAGSDPSAAAKAASRLDELAGDAPDDIKDDLVTLADAYHQIADAGNDPEALAGIDAAALTAAGGNIEQWESDNC